MLPKQDRISPRSAKELEQKYNLGTALESGKENYAGQQDQIARLNQTLSQFMAYVTGRLEELDDDSRTWFNSGVPTLETQPAVRWKTEEAKLNHIGDMYYDNDTGKIYLFRCTNAEGENVFEWVQCFGA